MAVAAIFPLVALLALSLPSYAATPAMSSYTLFESGQVRPLAMSKNGHYLYAVNTPDNRLEIFVVEKDGLRPVSSIMVGMEPIAVAVRSEKEVWVVNHLSDSVSVVDVESPEKPHVTKTLLVGDEPRDVVFAGPGAKLGFVTTAHRGQNSSVDPQLTTPGVGRADVWVFDPDTFGTSAGSAPKTIITLFMDTPRSLEVTPDGRYVYVAGFQTGNKTTTVFEELVPDGGESNGGLASTRVDAAGVLQPETGLIVQNNGKHWVDELGRSWDHTVKFSLPDKDVFVIDAMANPPRVSPTSDGYYAGVGTTLFNMAVNPVNKKIYVSNTDARNVHRFEGHGGRLGSDHTVQGHFVESRISVLSNGSVVSRHLNKHIDYSVCCAPIPNAENNISVAQPMGMVVSRNGKTLFVAAFGSGKIAKYNTTELENDSFVPSEANQIPISGGGPTGLVLDENLNRVYVMTRFDNSLSVIDLNKNKEIQHRALYNPEPLKIVKGRKFLYDASYTSSHGDSSCAGCHISGDLDSLAWDLGDPDGTTIRNPGPFILGPSVPLPDGTQAQFNPDYMALKGPMTTQSLRGMANHGPMHWRGDRTGGNDALSAQPDRGTFNEDAAFKKFNTAFKGLLGRSAPLSADEIQAFTDFALQITYPPNPIRNLNNTLTAEQEEGRKIYFGKASDTFFNCNACHSLDRDGNREFGVEKPGFFGTAGLSAFIPEPQFMKIPHLRNLYQKVGMFGMAAIPSSIPGDNDFKGEQIRGFGFIHDGSVDTIFRFHAATIFAYRGPGTLGAFDTGNPGGFPFVPENNPLASSVNVIGQKMRREVEAFLLAYDSNLAPVVGQQITLNNINNGVVSSRIDLFIERAAANECELVAKLWQGNREEGYLYVGGGRFQPDRRSAATVPDYALREKAAVHGNTITYTCVPPGSGVRMGLDRDQNGIYDGDV